MQLYVIFGEYTEKVSDYLSKKYKIAGQERTIDAATDKLQECPDTFLVLGNALLSGMVGKNVNYGAVLIDNLKKLRTACPKSRVIIILASTAEDQLVKSIVQLGIYDIHQTDRVSIDSLFAYIENPKDFANFDVKIETEGKPGDVDFKDQDNHNNSRLYLGELFGKLKQHVPFKLPTKQDIRDRLPARAQASQNIQELTALTEDGLVPATNPKGLDPEALFVPPSWSPVDIKNLRREHGHIPIVLIGKVSHVEQYYRAGVDRCAPEITESLITEVKDLSRRIKALHAQASTDSLTGCHTRGFGDKWISQQNAAALIMLDLDDFKIINDTYGHAAGDLVLKTFGNFLCSSIRANDIAIRWGGEEFILGLPYTTIEEAQTMGNRILEGWKKVEIDFEGKPISVSFSGGIGTDVRAADQALYSAKGQGKNQILVHGQHSPEPSPAAHTKPTLAIVFGNQARDIADELGDAYQVVYYSNELGKFRGPADKFLICGKNESEFTEVIQALRVKNSESDIIIVFADKPSEDVAKGLSDVRVFIGEKFDREVLEYWLDGEKDISDISIPVPQVPRRIEIALVPVAKPRRKLPYTKLITVWNPAGQYMTHTARGLAGAAWEDVILANLNLDNPELDYWFGLDHKDASAKNAGILTMGDQLTMDLVAPLLRKKGGIRFLPVGYGFGISTPEIPHEILQSVIDALGVTARTIIISPCARYDAAPTVVALSRADIILIPFGTAQELSVAKQQLSELVRHQVVDLRKVVELLWGTTHEPKQIFGHRIRANLSMDSGQRQWQSIGEQLANLKIK